MGRHARWFFDQAMTGVVPLPEVLSAHLQQGARLFVPPLDVDAAWATFRRNVAGGGLGTVTSLSETVLEVGAVDDRGRSWTYRFGVDPATGLINDLRLDRVQHQEVTVRFATEADGPALTEIERRSPMVMGEVTVTIDRGGDYFAAARLMGDVVVVVAEIDGEPAAAHCAAAHTVHVGGGPYRLGYFHHLRILPEHQGKGLFGRMAEKMGERYYPPHVDGSYAYVSADNAASQRLFSMSTAWPVQPLRCTLDSASHRGPAAGRPATPEDTPDIIEVLNTCHSLLGNVLVLSPPVSGWNRPDREKDHYQPPPTTPPTPASTQPVFLTPSPPPQSLQERRLQPNPLSGPLSESEASALSSHHLGDTLTAFSSRLIGQSMHLPSPGYHVMGDAGRVTRPSSGRRTRGAMASRAERRKGMPDIVRNVPEPYGPFRGSAGRLIDREGECRLLDQLVGAVQGGESRALILHGEAGVGKTALLEYLSGRASDAGCRVLSAAGVQSEMELAFASLHQLCTPLLDRVSAIPQPQQDALLTTFGRTSGPVPDRFLVGLAVLSLLAEVAADTPLVCRVDDFQWLDSASAQVLAFVARRLGAESVAMVFGARVTTAEMAGLPKALVEGLADEHARALLELVLRGPVDPRVRDEILAETSGNPLALLELPRGMTAVQLAGGFGLPGTLGLSASMEESFRRRAKDLPLEARRLLLLAAAEPLRDPALLWGAAARLGISTTAAQPVEDAGLIEFGPRVRFRHPLVRSAVYQSASAQERRQVHAALAEVTDPELDPDRRAWHRAQAALGPDEDVAAELERSAGRAQARGGLAAAAAFLERSVLLSEDPVLRARTDTGGGGGQPPGGRVRQRPRAAHYR